MRTPPGTKTYCYCGYIMSIVSSIYFPLIIHNPTWAPMTSWIATCRSGFPLEGETMFRSIKLIRTITSRRHLGFVYHTELTQRFNAHCARNMDDTNEEKVGACNCHIPSYSAFISRPVSTKWGCGSALSNTCR